MKDLEIRSSWIWVGPKSNDWCQLKEGEGHRDRETSKGRPCGDRSRDWSDPGQETSRVAGSPQKLEGRHGTDSPSEVPESITLLTT